MHWFRQYELSADDFNRLDGTAMMTTLQQHKLLVSCQGVTRLPKHSDLKLPDLTSAFHVRVIDKKTFEILFTNREDLEFVEQHLTQFKLSLD